MPNLNINRLFSLLPWLISLALILVFVALLAHELKRQDDHWGRNIQLHESVQQMLDTLDISFSDTAAVLELPTDSLETQLHTRATLETLRDEARRETVAKWLLALVLVEVFVLLLLHFGITYIRRLIFSHQVELERERDHIENARQQLLLALESSDSGYWEWDIATNHVHFSEEWKTMFGMSASDKGQSDMEEWLARVHPADKQLCYDELRAHVRGETAMYEVEHRIMDNTGHYRWFLSRGKVVQWRSDGKAVRLVGVYTDTTIRKQNQVMLLRQQEALRSLNDIASLPAIEPREQLRRALRFGADYLGMDIGLVSRVEADHYQVRVQISPEEAQLYDGQNFDLVNTYCKLMLDSGDLLAIDQMGCSEHADYPPYLENGLESYIGAPIWVEGHIYGSLGFAALNSRQEPFDSADKDFVRLLARWVGAVFERWLRGEARRELLQRFTKLSDQLPGVLFQLQQQLDGTRLFPYASAGLYEIYGVQPEEVKESAAALFAVIHPDDSSSVSAAIRHSAEMLTPWHSTYRIRHPEYGERWVQVSSTPELQQDGSILWHGFCADITEAKRAEQAFQQLSSLRQAILDGASVAIISTDPRGIIQTFNRGAEKMLGYCASELAGKATPLIFHDPDEIDEHSQCLEGELGLERDCRFPALFSRAAAGHVDENQWTYVRKDGTRLTVLLSVTALKSAEGEITGFLGIARDISELKQAILSLKVSEERFLGAFDTAPQGMALVSLAGEWIEVNRALCHMLGYTREEMLLIDFQQITHPDDLRTDLELVLDVLAGNISSYQLEKRYIHKCGDEVWVLLSVSLVRDGQGQPLHFVSQMLDITERKRVEQLKSEFIATVSHELRTPLTSISGSLGLLEGGVAGDLTPKAQKMVGIAQKNAQRLKHLVDDLLDMEKLEAGKMHFDLHEQSVLPIVHQSLEFNSGYAAQYQIMYQLAPDSEDGLVNVDVQRLLQVMANYLSNAAKFSPPGEIVLVSVRRLGSNIRVTVSDRGPGIPDEFRSRIFQKFSQADSSDTRQKGGTGLGLAICKDLMNSMQGSVGFDSVPGSGASFYLELPLCDLP